MPVRCDLSGGFGDERRMLKGDGKTGERGTTGDVGEAVLPAWAARRAKFWRRLPDFIVAYPFPRAQFIAKRSAELDARDETLSWRDDDKGEAFSNPPLVHGRLVAEGTRGNGERAPGPLPPRWAWDVSISVKSD